MGLCVDHEKGGAATKLHPGWGSSRVVNHRPALLETRKAENHMLTFCIALVIQGQTACFNGKEMYCLDDEITAQAIRLPTCKAYSARVSQQMEACKRLGLMSEDGSTSSCPMPMVGPK